MKLWHQTEDADRTVFCLGGRWWVYLVVGSRQLEPEEYVWAEYNLEQADGSGVTGFRRAVRAHDRGANQYWRVKLGPFETGERLEYCLSIFGLRGDARTDWITVRFGQETKEVTCASLAKASFVRVG